MTRGHSSAGVTLPLLVGAVSVAFAVYLMVWALRRQPRDKQATAVIGGVLLLCGSLLVVIALTDRSSGTPQPEPAPTAQPAPAGA